MPEALDSSRMALTTPLSDWFLVSAGTYVVLGVEMYIGEGGRRS